MLCCSRRSHGARERAGRPGLRAACGGDGVRQRRVRGRLGRAQQRAGRGDDSRGGLDGRG